MHQRTRRRLNSVDAFVYFFDLRECLRSLQCTAESPRRSKTAQWRKTCSISVPSSVLTFSSTMFHRFWRFREMYGFGAD
jgi:hypothetical protein